MSFRDDIASDLEELLDDEELGETFTYTPANGPARQITGHVVRPGFSKDDKGTHADRKRLAEVTVLRDASNATRGGIDQPKRGDEITFADGAVFRWTEEIKHRDSAGWTLIYQLSATTTLGKTNR